VVTQETALLMLSLQALEARPLKQSRVKRVSVMKRCWAWQGWKQTLPI